jgi:hypothetical protein
MLWEASLRRLLSSEFDFSVFDPTSPLSAAEVSEINLCRCAVVAGDGHFVARPLLLDSLRQLSIPLVPYISLFPTTPGAELTTHAAQAARILHDMSVEVGAIDRATASTFRELELDNVRVIGPPSLFWACGATLPEPVSRRRENLFVALPPRQLSNGNEAHHEQLLLIIDAIADLTKAKHVTYAAYDADDRILWSRNSVPEQAIVRSGDPQDQLATLTEHDSVLASLDPDLSALAIGNGIPTVNLAASTAAAEFCALVGVEAMLPVDRSGVQTIARRIQQAMDGDFGRLLPDQNRFQALRSQMDEFLREHDLPVALDRTNEIRLYDQLSAERRSRDLEASKLSLAAKASALERNVWRDSYQRMTVEVEQLKSQLAAVPWRAVGIYRAARRFVPRAILDWLVPIVDRFRGRR